MPDGALAAHLHLISERNLALAVTDSRAMRGIAVFDLQSGKRIEILVPRAKDSDQELTITSLTVGSDRIAAMAYDGNSSPRQFFIFVYDAADRTLLHQLDFPEQYSDHAPEIGTPDSLLITGEHLLVKTALRDRIDNNDPVMLQYDLASGAFVRGIGLMEFDPNAEKGWFGPRSSTPDYFFANAVTAEGVLFTAPMPWDQPEPVTVLAFDLDRDEVGDALPTVDGTGRFATLAAVDGNNLFYTLTPPLATQQNVIAVGAAIRVERDTGKVLATYSDPFAPETGDMSMNEFIASHAATGVKPYAGSRFPEGFSVSEDYVVASAPNAPVSDNPGAGAVVIFDVETGKPLSLILPEAAGHETHFGRVFAHQGNLVLISTQNNIPSPERGAQELVLYSID